MKNTYDPPEDDGNEINVGRQMRLLRRERGLSLRSLADLSGLNFNTLSLIETGKTSPSVSTLQQVANALGIAITAFFDSQPVKKSIIHQKSGARPHVAYSQLILEDMAAGLNLRKAQPFLVTMEAGASSGLDAIVHTGHEFVYLIEGSITYTIDGDEYHLEPGDSLVFEAPLPHQWANTGKTPSRSLLILCPADENDQPTERHFMNRGDLELI